MAVIIAAAPVDAPRPGGPESRFQTRSRHARTSLPVPPPRRPSGPDGDCAVPAVTYRQGRFWQPDVTVATVVAEGGRVLCVEERSGGRLVLNQPAGHLEPDEDLVQAAVRETLEESGWTVEPTAFIGAYQWTAPDGDDGRPGRHYLRFAFAARPLAHDPARPLDEGIVRTLWMTPAELQAESARHRSPLVWRVVADYLSGSRQPLSLLRSVR